MHLVSVGDVQFLFLIFCFQDGKESSLNGQSGVTFMNAASCNATVKTEFYSGSLSLGEVSPRSLALEIWWKMRKDGISFFFSARIRIKLSDPYNSEF